MAEIRVNTRDMGGIKKRERRENNEKVIRRDQKKEAEVTVKQQV